MLGGWIGPVDDAAVHYVTGLAQEAGLVLPERTASIDLTESNEWICSHCTFANVAGSMVCGACDIARAIGGLNSFQPRGACRVPDCAMLQFEPCTRFMARTDISSSLCGFCACDYSQHTVLAEEPEIVKAAQTHSYLLSPHIFASDIPVENLMELSSAVFEKVEYFLNHVVTETYLCEHIVMFVNALVETTSAHRCQNEKSLMELLHSARSLFGYVSDHPYLSSRLKQSLAQRLARDRCVQRILEKRITVPFEHLLAVAFRDLLGFSHFAEISKMVGDYEFSKLLSQDFAVARHSAQISFLLGSGAVWPIECGRTAAWNVPECLRQGLAAAENYVHSRKFPKYQHRGRFGEPAWVSESAGSAVHLRWNPALGYAVVLMSQLGVELIVSTLQMCILLQFNKRESWTFAQLLTVRKKHSCHFIRLDTRIS